MSTKTYANNSNVPLSVAAWLVNDDYDYNDDPNVISVTTLIKPVKQVILSSRVSKDPTSTPIDIISLVKSRLGQAVHTAIEKTWADNPNLPNLLKALNLPPKLIKRVLINPSKNDIKPDSIPVYLEQRLHRKLGPYTISGKFDLCFNGQLEDVKTTSTFTYSAGSKDEDYTLQGSLYRWLNPQMITENSIRINYIFTDWKPALVSTPNYPSAPQISVEYPLMSLVETENWIKRRLQAHHDCVDAPEEDMPECTSKELWRSDPVWKYYNKSQKEQSRATKNFTDRNEANSYFADKGFKGELVEVPGEVKACKYCAGFEICKQKNQYILDGSLKV